VSERVNPEGMEMSDRGLDRRSFLAAGAAGAAGLLGAPAVSFASHRRQWSGRPNILVVLFDDLGIGDLGAYGSRLIRTPRVDRLARTGVRFDAMYAAAATDSPSRAGIFTGRYGARFSVPGSIRPDVAGGLPADVPTVAAALTSAGYTTALFGQWRLGSGPGQHPLDKGFDLFSGTLYGTDVAPLAWYEGRTQTEAATDIGLSSRRIHEAAEAFVDGLSDSELPFFAVLSLLVPHAPFHAEPRHAGRSDAGMYGDVVESVDRYLDDLLAGLQRRRHGADTLVIVTSDNGPRYEGSTQRRRGRKPEVMDGGVLVPFIASWLDRRLGLVDRTPRSLLDLTPTLCAFARAPAPAAMDGWDMSRLLRAGARASRGPVFLFYNQWLNAMRSDRWKLHHRYGNNTRTYMPQLFDVHADPREAFNLAEYRPALVAALLPQLEAVRAGVNAEAAGRAVGAAA
jgi:arylsulfatase A